MLFDRLRSAEMMFAVYKSLTEIILVAAEQRHPPLLIQLARQRCGRTNISPSITGVASESHSGLVRILNDKILSNTITGVHMIWVAP